MALPVKSTETREQLEQRLDHKQDMVAADAAVKHIVQGKAFPVDAWEGSATAEQVKIAYAELRKKKQ